VILAGAMARFVLVHGAWHGSWCFGALVRELTARGHTAEAIDLPCDVVGLTQLDYAAHIGPQPEAVVVGHSLAAQTIPHVDAALRVYLGGLLPVEGAAENAFRPEFHGSVRDEHGRSYWPDADTCAARLYPDCTRVQADWAFARLRRQARVALAQAPFGAGDAVIATRHDAAIDADWQAETGRRHGATVIDLASGHSPFFTQPEELAELLDDLSGAVREAGGDTGTG
jgi:Alpha/beta hydrolase family